VKAAVIGIGKMGMLHAGIVNALDGMELAAVAEPSGFLASAVKSLKPGLPVYEDYGPAAG